MDSLKENKRKIAAFRRKLFSWHQTHYRPMRWRNTHDPYKIMVSEIMLQQTQVGRVKESYDAFLRRFKTIRTLADAPLSEVLQEWKGLGYNRRAKYLHQSAKIIVHDLRGNFPKTMEDLCQLPGIGQSTAAAIMAFAFDQDYPMIDTNVKRILNRVFFYGDSAMTDRQYFEFAKSLIPKGKGRAWNYAMLDLGATVCTARGHSDECPMIPLHGAYVSVPQKRPQGTFINSRRYWRGKVIDLLREKHVVNTSYMRSLFREVLKFDEILYSLEKEGLIVQENGKFRLPG